MIYTVFDFYFNGGDTEEFAKSDLRLYQRICNPMMYIELLKENRIIVGVQSFREEELKSIKRVYGDSVKLEITKYSSEKDMKEAFDNEILCSGGHSWIL